MPPAFPHAPSRSLHAPVFVPCLQGLGYFPPEQEELQKMLVRWTVAYR